MENGTRTYMNRSIRLNYPLQKIVSFQDHENALQFSVSSVKKGIRHELVSRKETIGLSFGIACLQANGAPHKGVLIIGAPGIGKTSLVRWLCLGWAQGKLLQVGWL